MSRIPYVRREELGPEGQQLWDSIVNGRGDLVVTAGGGLAGPFNAFVTAPGAGRRLSSLGAALRSGTSIERRLSEIAIITTGARCRARFLGDAGMVELVSLCGYYTLISFLLNALAVPLPPGTAPMWARS
jgi:hypothetical protein